jgi:hypothetical protein
MNRAALRAVLASAALAGCGDLLPEADRVPTSLRLDRDTVTVAEGDAVPVGVTVLDQAGQPMGGVPSWAGPVWTLSGASVAAEGSALRGVAPGQTLGTVSVGGLSTTAVLRVNPRALELVVDGAYLTQGVHRTDGSHLLVAGRDALLRVFVRGDQLNFFRPRVRVQLFQNGAPDQTLEMTATGDSVPLQRREEALASSWNVRIPGASVRPGMSLVVEADPAGTVPRRGASRTRFPAAGALMPDVRTVPKFWMRLVPIRQAVHGTTGRVTEANKAQYIQDLLGMHPIADYDVDVRAPFTTSFSSATGDGWSGIISEIRALRLADASSRYYYGLLTAAQGSGIAGLGYLGFPVAIGYDDLPGSANTLAHELGHNFGRPHTTCTGTESGVDPAYPHAGGSIGAWGYDPFTQVLKSPATERDLMSYCRPRWASDYTFNAVLAFRRSGDGGTRGDAAPDAPAEPSLLVWGRLGENAATVEPAFEVTTQPVLPSRPGPYTLRGLDAAGNVLFSYPFDASGLGEESIRQRHFAFAIPARLAQVERLAALRVTGPGVAAERRRASGAGLRPAAPRALGRRSGRRVELQWPADRLPVAMVRDARTGQVLGFARGGRAALETQSGELDVTFSDGVRSVRAAVEVQP